MPSFTHITWLSLIFHHTLTLLLNGLYDIQVASRPRVPRLDLSSSTPAMSRRWMSMSLEQITSGKLTVCDGKLPFGIGKSTDSAPFSSNMLHYQGVHQCSFGDLEWCFFWRPCNSVWYHETWHEPGSNTAMIPSRKTINSPMNGSGWTSLVPRLFRFGEMISSVAWGWILPGVRSWICLDWLPLG